MSWKKGTLLQIQANWGDVGRDCTCLGPDIELSASNVKWTPVLWADEDDPDWFKTRGLEKRTKNKYSGHFRR